MSTYPKIVPPSTNLRPRISGTDSVGTAAMPFSGAYVNTLYVNGAQVTASGLNDTGANIGTGTGVFAQKVGANLQFKSLTGISGTTITSDASNIYVMGGKVLSVNGLDGNVSLTTTNIPEGSGLYYLDSRARTVVSGTSPISVSNALVSIASGSAIQNGYISSGDWTKFNNKQPAGNYVLIAGDTMTGQLNAPTLSGATILTNNITSDALLTIDAAGIDAYTVNNEDITFSAGTGTATFQTDNSFVQVSETDLLIYTSGSQVNLYGAGNIDLLSTTQINTTGSIIPTSSGIDSLGSSALPFSGVHSKNAFINTLYADAIDLDGTYLSNVVVPNVVRVSQFANGGFTNIAPAVASISGASATSPYVIFVEPGIYLEPEITVPSYVSIVGRDESSVFVRPNGNNSIFNMLNLSTLAFLSLQNVPSGYSAVKVTNPGDYVLMHKVTVTDADTAITAIANDGGTDHTLYLEYVDTSQGNTTEAGFKFLCDTASSSNLSVSCENFYVLTESSNPPIGILASGVGLDVAFRASALLGIDQTGYGIEILDGANVRMPVLGIRNWATGISVPQYGADPGLKIFSTSFDGNADYNLYIEHSGCAGFSNAYSEYNKKYINPDSSFFFVNKDQKIITVDKKGGDFTSVVDALNSITDNNSTNQYDIQVGPGIYIENQIQTKPYVAIQGQGSNTILQPINPNQNFIIGTTHSFINNLTITGASGTNSSAVYYSDPSGTSTDYFYVEHVTFGENYTHAEAYAINGKRSLIQINNCRLGNVYPFTVGFYAHNDGSVNSIGRMSIRNSQTTGGMSVPYPSGLFYATGSGCEITSNGGMYRTGQTTSVTNNSYAVRSSNGANIKIYSTLFQGFNIGIWDENINLGTNLIFNGSDIENCNTHILQENPNSTGALQGSFNRTLSSFASPYITILTNDSASNSATIMGDLYLGKTFNTLQYSSPLLFNTPTMGLIQGGAISPGAGLNINVSTGYGYLDTDPSDWTKTKYISWSGSSLPLPSGSDNYIYFNSNAILSYSPIQINGEVDKILLGRVVTTDVGIDFIEHSPQSASHIGNKLEELFRDAFGPIVANGLNVVASGLQFDVLGGEYYWGSQSIDVDSLALPAFLEFYHVSGNWTANYNASGVVSNNQWDNGVNLSGITAGYFTKHALWLDGQDSLPMLVYGQAEYSGLSTAQIASTPIPSTTFKDSIVHIADIIVQQGSGTISQVMDTRPVVSFKQSLASTTTANDHHTLLNLTTYDDHTQYLNLNGTRAMAGDLSLGGNNIINVNQVGGIVPSGHASRHLPNGLDPLTSAAPLVNLNLNSTNSVGVQNSFARSDQAHAFDIGLPVTISALTNSSGTSPNFIRADHLHAHGIQSDGTLHTVATSSHNGFLASGDWISFNNRVDKDGDTMSGTLYVPTLSGTLISGNTINAVGNLYLNSIPVITSGLSLDSGYDIFAQKNGNNLEFKSLAALGSVTLTSDSNKVYISGTDTGEVNTASNSGNGIGVYITKIASDLVFSSLSGIGTTSLSSSNGNIYISGSTTYISGTSPISVLNGDVSISSGSSIANGYISSGDWTIFNNKQASGNYLVSGVSNTDALPEGVTNLYYSNTLVDGHLSGTSGITYSNGNISTTLTQYTDTLARAVVSGSSPINVSNAYVTIASGSSIANGYISSGDWVIFNNKQASGNYVVSGTSTVLNILDVTTLNANLVSGSTINASSSLTLNGNNVITSGTSLGTASSIFSQKNGSNLEFKTVSGVGIVSLTSDSNTVYISGTATPTFTSPTTTTNAGITSWSGTTATGFLSSATTINASGSITLASGTNLLSAVSGTSDIGTASSTINNLYVNSITTPQTEYVFAYDINNQTIGTGGVFQDITFSNNGNINGWTHTATTSSFTANKSGLYLVTYKANVEKTVNPNSTIEFRGLFNGVEIAGSQSTELINANNLPINHAGSFVVNVTSGQIFKLQMAGTTTTTRIRGGLGVATTKPSISLTITRLGV